MTSYCTRCHSTEFRFSEYSHSYVCALCGASMPIADTSNDVLIRCQRVRDYIRTEQMNYAMNELQSLRQQVPGNIEVQQLYLLALTNHYTQCLPGNVAEIEKTFRVLKNMGALPEEAQRYYYEKLNSRENELIRDYNKTKIYLVLVLATILILIYTGHYFLTAVAVFVLFKYRFLGNFYNKRKLLLNFYQNPAAF